MASYSDDFDRGDSGDLGSNWTDQMGGFSIVSNKAVPDNIVINDSYWNTALDGPDQSVEVDVEIAGGSENFGGPAARHTSGAITFYLFYYYLESSAVGWGLWKVEAGDQTAIDNTASGTGTITMRLDVDGAIQGAYVDESLELSGTDSDITTGNYAGIVNQYNEGQMDNWSAADISTDLSINVNDCQQIETMLI